MLQSSLSTIRLRLKAEPRLLLLLLLRRRPERGGPWSAAGGLAPSRREYVGYAEINKGFKGIMNFRVLAASAQAPQRSNGNDFLPHNAPRLEKGGGWGGWRGRGHF